MEINELTQVILPLATPVGKLLTLLGRLAFGRKKQENVPAISIKGDNNTVIHANHVVLNVYLNPRPKRKRKLKRSIPKRRRPTKK